MFYRDRRSKYMPIDLPWDFFLHWLFPKHALEVLIQKDNGFYKVLIKESRTLFAMSFTWPVEFDYGIVRFGYQERNFAWKNGMVCSATYLRGISLFYKEEVVHGRKWQTMYLHCRHKGRTWHGRGLSYIDEDGVVDLMPDESDPDGWYE